MFKIILVLSLLVCLPDGVKAAEIMDQIILSKEKEFLAQMKKKNLPPEKVFESYILAGEEFSRSNELKWAAYFFKQASQLPGVKNKLPAHLREMSTLLAIPDEKAARDLYPTVAQEFKKQKRTDEDRAKLLLYKILVSNKLHDEVLGTDELSFMRDHNKYFGGIKRHDVKVLLDRGNYKEVSSIYEGESIKNANIDEKILYDLANTLGKDKKKPLLCQSQYDQYPQSRNSSYTMVICHMLIQKRESKKPAQEDLKKAKDIISSRFPNSRYLIPILERL